MKLAIFGASGATGKQIIEQALAAGNQVAAFARNPSKIGASHERLTIVQGELSDTAAIERAVGGADAVISSSTPSASDSNDLPDFKFKVLVAIVKSVMRPAYEEIVNVARIVRESDTDWTIVRASLLNNNPGSGRIRAGYLGKKQVGTNISRADLAAFMLKQAQDTTYLRQAPAISN
jgi:putative NADH-flavin reductase